MDRSALLPDFSRAAEPPIADDIRALLPELRGHILQAAEAILADPANVALLSMRAIAGAASVPPVTMVRLAQRLGLEGYSKLRQPYVEMMKSSVGGNLNTARKITARARTRGTAGFINAFFEAEQSILGETLAALPLAALETAVKRLAHGRHIYIIARRSTYPVSWAMSYSLRKVRPRVSLIADGNPGPETELLDCSPDDVLVAMTFAPYSRMTFRMAELAASRGATVIAITDKLSAPIAAIAAHVFPTEVNSQSFPESMIGAHALANLLVALVVTEVGDPALERVAESDEHIISNGEFIEPTRNRRGRKRIPPAC